MTFGLLKGFWLVVKLAFLIGIALFLIQYPGELEIQWIGYTTQLGLGTAILFLLLVGLVIWGVVNIWRKLCRLPESWLRRREKYRQRKGQRAVLEGMISIAAEDADEAEQYAKQALKLSADHPLKSVLDAQIASLRGSEKEVFSAFKSLTEKDDTAFLGWRGLALQARHGGDWESTRKYLLKAREEKPHSPWVLQQLIELNMRLELYDQVQPLVEKLQARKILTKQQKNHYIAFIAWLKAQQSLEKKDTSEHQRLLIKAFEHGPDVPAIARDLATLYIGKNKPQKALKIVTTTLSQAPHPALGDIHRQLQKPIKALGYYRELEKLLRNVTDHPEARFLKAKAAFQAKLWGQARHELDILLNQSASRRACLLMAQIEASEDKGRASEEALWREKAETALTSGYWQCLSCQAAPSDWHVICQRCGTMGSIIWQSQPSGSIQDIVIEVGKDTRHEERSLVKPR